MSVTRTLVLMRHAKSGYPGGVGDHDRPLADRGRREGAIAGSWIRDHLPPIEAVLCSTALRTRQTLEVTGLDAPAEFDAAIYEAAPETILERIGQVDKAVAALLVLGHAPGIPGLAMELADEQSSPEALRILQLRFPTSAIAVLRTEQPWDKLDLGGARLVEFHIPRD